MLRAHGTWQAGVGRGACDAPSNENGPHKAARFPPVRGGRRVAAYFSFASARSASALSVFSHENAVNVLPSAAFSCTGLRPKWP